MSHAGMVFAKTCYERHDRQCFDGAPCGRDQWVLVGAVDSCTQGRPGKRITVSSIQIHKEREVDINMHRYRRSTEALSKSVHRVNIHTRRTRHWTLMPVFFCAIFPASPLSPPPLCQRRMHLSAPKAQSSV